MSKTRLACIILRQSPSITDICFGSISEASKGCTLFTLSRHGVSPLRLAYAIGRRAALMRWRHHEEWISLNSDTAKGFQFEAEVNLQETPTLLTLLGETNQSPNGYVMDIFVDPVASVEWSLLFFGSPY